jgi:3-oxoacyl-[acyl-carrier protein] reductase
MKGRVAFVSGTSGGIGGAIALELARQGADVAVHHHRNRAGAEAVAEAVRALGRRAEVFGADLGAETLPEDLVERVESALGRVSLLACAAGMYRPGMAAFLDPDDWDEVFRVNLRGTFLLCQAFLPAMLRAREGSVVMVGSESAETGSAGMGAYTASKAGLVGLMRTLALEAGPRGVRVNLVSPGVIETGMLAELDADKRAAIASRTALGRLGSPEEVASAVAFLLSEAARYITGAVLPVNGGFVTL